MFLQMLHLGSACRGLTLLLTIASLIKSTAQMSQTCLAVVRLHVHCWFAVHNGDLARVGTYRVPKPWPDDWPVLYACQYVQ